MRGDYAPTTKQGSETTLRELHPRNRGDMEPRNAMWPSVTLAAHMSAPAFQTGCLPACLPGCLVASLLRLSASSLFALSSACLLLYHVYRWFYRCYATWHGRGLRGESSMILITDSYIEVSTLISSNDQGEAERSIVTKSCGEISRTKIFDSIQVCNNGGPVVFDRP